VRALSECIGICDFVSIRFPKIKQKTLFEDKTKPIGGRSL